VSPYQVGFDIKLDRPRRLVTVTLVGIPSPEDIGWIAEEARAAILKLGPDAGQHRTLYDARGVPVLPQATADFVLQNFVNAEMTHRARRVAFVASTALTRRQVRRIADVRPGSMLFEDLDAARAWLLESE
jgi:hypothetical protein